MLKSLPTRWETYKQALTDAEQMLKINKVFFNLFKEIFFLMIVF